MKRGRRSKQQIIVAVIAAMLALLMILPLLITALQWTAAASVSDLEKQILEYQNRAKEYDAQVAEAKENLAKIAGQKSNAIEQKRYWDSQITAINGQIENTTEIIALLDQQIEIEEANLAEAEVREAEQFELFCRRVRAMEETGSVSYIGILFQASSFSDLLDRYNAVAEVMEYDNAVMDALAAARQEVFDKKTELEQTRAAQEQEKENLIARKQELDEAAAQAQALVRQIEAQEDAYEAEYKKLMAEVEAVSAAIAKKEKELAAAIAANKIQFDPGTGWYWPLPAEYVSITSFQGGRPHPITGKWQTHTGVDIAAPNGTKIFAARGGVIITSAYNSSYGNYVVVGHDGGQSTLYAHMSRRAVNEGDVVAQGQVIGYVGTTGSSTGYHLHFELRVDGVRKNALDYYPNIKWVDRT